jgi:hypothetical protein
MTLKSFPGEGSIEHRSLVITLLQMGIRGLEMEA